MIALSLITILLTFLFSFFIQSAKIEKKLDVARMFVSNRGYLQTRLTSIFTSLDQSSFDPCFYTKHFPKEKTKSLIIQFDNGIDPDPAFSGTVLGKIFLDDEKNLCLAIWPMKNKKSLHWRKDILFPKIKNFDFEFLGKMSASDHGSKEFRPINAEWAWRSEWPKSMGTVPGMIRLKLHEESRKEPIYYAFILPVIEPFITYKEKTAL